MWCQQSMCIPNTSQSQVFWTSCLAALRRLSSASRSSKVRPDSASPPPAELGLLSFCCCWGGPGAPHAAEADCLRMLSRSSSAACGLLLVCAASASLLGEELSAVASRPLLLLLLLLPLLLSVRSLSHWYESVGLNWLVWDHEGGVEVPPRSSRRMSSRPICSSSVLRRSWVTPSTSLMVGWKVFKVAPKLFTAWAWDKHFGDSRLQAAEMQ